MQPKPAPSAPHLSSRRVPYIQDPAVVAIAENAECGDIELQPSGGGDVQREPRHGHGPQDVPVGESEDPVLVLGGQRNELERPTISPGGCFAARASILEQLPVRARLVDLCGSDALVVAIVEFAEKRGDMWIGEARNLCRAAGALQRAGVNGGEVDADEPAAQSRGALLAPDRQR